jgi:hypothetical protein
LVIIVKRQKGTTPPFQYPGPFHDPDGMATEFLGLFAFNEIVIEWLVVR